MLIKYDSEQRKSNIKLFTTTRRGGISQHSYDSFNVSPFCGDNPEHVKHNLQILAGELNITPENIIIPFQTHGTGIQKIDADFMGLDKEVQSSLLNGIDALVTKIPGICIGVTTADCVPIFLYDITKQVVAVAHAGWRGTCAKIAAKTIQLMQSDYGCNPENIQAVIGPSISVNAYQVGGELHQAFEDAGFPVDEIFICNDTRLYLDLWKANEILLLREGLKANHITVSGPCTYTEHELFFSARRLGIKSGRMLSGIYLQE
jgi:YfiH family protein